MSAASRRWLFGPVPDLTPGCGLAYAVVFVAMGVAGDSFREFVPFAVAILPIHLISSAGRGTTALREGRIARFLIGKRPDATQHGDALLERVGQGRAARRLRLGLLGAR